MIRGGAERCSSDAVVAEKMDGKKMPRQYYVHP